MKALGLDYNTFYLKETDGVSQAPLYPDSILEDEASALVVEIIRRTFATGYKAGARLFAPHTSRLHQIKGLDEVTHARILRAHIHTLREAVKNCLNPTAERPELFLWAANYHPPLSTQRTDLQAEAAKFHKTQSQVAAEYNMPIYYGTIGSKKEALLAAIGASRGDAETITLGLVVDNNGKLLHDKSLPSDIVQSVATHFPGVTFGFDYCSAKGALAAFEDLETHGFNGLVVSYFPYIEDMQNAWDMPEPEMGEVAIPITSSLKVFDTAQRLRVQRTGWVCGHTSQDLATLTARLRYSKNTHVPMQNAPSAAGGIITLFSNNDGAPTIFAPPPSGSISEPPASSRP